MIRKVVWMLAGVLFLSSSLLLAAGGSSQAGSGSFAAAEDLVVVELTSQTPLTSADDVLWLRIFGDGRVVSNRSDSEILEAGKMRWLSSAELQGLLEEIIARGLFAFDRKSVKQQLVEAQRRREREKGGVPVFVDATTFRLVLRLDELSMSDSSEPLEDVEKVIAWNALGPTAEAYPGIQALQQLDVVVNVLRQLRSRVEASTEGQASEITVSDLLESYRAN